MKPVRHKDALVNDDGKPPYEPREALVVLDSEESSVEEADREKSLPVEEHC